MYINDYIHMYEEDKGSKGKSYYHLLPGTLWRNSCWYFPIIRNPSSSSTRWTGLSKLKLIQSLSGPTTSIMLPQRPTTAPDPHLQYNRHNKLIQYTVAGHHISGPSHSDKLKIVGKKYTHWNSETEIKIEIVKKLYPKSQKLSNF